MCVELLTQNTGCIEGLRGVEREEESIEVEKKFFSVHVFPVKIRFMNFDNFSKCSPENKLC